MDEHFKAKYMKYMQLDNPTAIILIIIIFITIIVGNFVTLLSNN